MKTEGKRDSRRTATPSFGELLLGGIRDLTRPVRLMFVPKWLRQYKRDERRNNRRHRPKPH